jgi:predicted transcriptional regulator
MISLIRRKTTGQILRILLKEKQVSHGDLSSQLSISSQALTWQMNQLKKKGVVQGIREGMKTIYFLDEASAPTLRRYINLAGKNKRP